jgi:hypothetical protein
MHREPRQAKQSPYSKVNAYNQPLDFWQIALIVVFVVIITIHSVFIISPIVASNHPLLWVMLGLHYVAIIIMAYDYLFITFTDPVDLLVADPEKTVEFKDN